MSERKKAIRKRLRPGMLLPLAAAVMVLLAAASVAKLLLEPDIKQLMAGFLPAADSSGSQQVSRASTTDSTGSASVPESSQAASSSAVSSQGGYAYFKDAVFVGDSITSGVKLYNTAENAGVFAGNAVSAANALTANFQTADGSVSLAQAIGKVKPAKIYILLGANDITWTDADKFASSYTKLLETLKESAPDAKYYVQSILPVSASYAKKSGVTSEKIASFNAALSKVCEEEKTTYVDAGKALEGADGYLAGEFSASGYNLSQAAYKKWFDYLSVHES